MNSLKAGWRPASVLLLLCSCTAHAAPIESSKAQSYLRRIQLHALASGELPREVDMVAALGPAAEKSCGEIPYVPTPSGNLTKLSPFHSACHSKWTIDSAIELNLSNFMTKNGDIALTSLSLYPATIDSCIDQRYLARVATLGDARSRSIYPGSHAISWRGIILTKIETIILDEARVFANLEQTQEISKESTCVIQSSIARRNK